ncbi:MAG TPA: TylF/MycF family methyltransferase [Dehalococcoidia bacterium]
MTSCNPDLYLSLLKRTLTRYDLEGEWRYELYQKEGHGVDAKLKRAVQTAVRKRGLELVRAVRIDLALREDGREVSADIAETMAETMIGLVRLNQLQAAIEDVIAKNIPGDLIETGVWRGGACIFMRGVLAAHQVTDRTVWVADSFEGLPRPSGEYPIDSGGIPFWEEPVLAVSQEEVERNFAKYGLLDGQVRFLKGWFKDTLPTAPIDRLSVLRLDGDMYESTIQTLDALYWKVSAGGYVIVDDYGALEVCRAAVEDFRNDHGITAPITRIDWGGVYWQV